MPRVRQAVMCNYLTYVLFAGNLRIANVSQRNILRKFDI